MPQMANQLFIVTSSRMAVRGEGVDKDVGTGPCDGLYLERKASAILGKPAPPTGPFAVPPPITFGAMKQ